MGNIQVKKYISEKQNRTATEIDGGIHDAQPTPLAKFNNAVLINTFNIGNQ